jgi:hypothetical protein
MFSMLQNLEHTICTAYGDSEETYGGDLWVIPMQGVYQGNGVGHLIWVVVSSLLLDIMREEGFGTFFKTSISSQDIRFLGYAFVDDTDLIQTSKDGTETGDEMREQMQIGVDLWKGIIDVTGRALAVEKSCWWLIDFIWDDQGNFKYAAIKDTPGQLTVKDWDGIVKPIQRMEPTEAYETLGLWMAPDGNLHKQFDRLLTMVKQWIERRGPFLQRNPEPKCPSKVQNDGLTRPNGKIGEVPFREKQGKTRISVGGGMSAALKLHAQASKK